jgi:heat shock protein HslJ/membrane-bound inhibitor of C-type lysozyme
MIRRTAAFTAIAAALAACTPEDDGLKMPAVSVTAAETHVFICGDTQVEIAFTDEGAIMTSGGRTWNLVAAMSGSGARYTLPNDDTTEFWNKGDNAMVRLDGQDLPECTIEKPKPYVARGNEPGWRLEILDGQAGLLADYGERQVTGPLDAPQMDGAITRYAAPALNLSITVEAKYCEDDATGMPHPDTVAVALPDRTYTGCGGDPLSLITGAEWVVEDISGAGVVDGSRPTLTFGADGSVSGRGSCNRYNGQYALTGEGITLPGPLASTEMACEPAVMDQEQRFFAIMGDLQSFSISPDGALVLQALNSGSITARR